MKIGKLILHYNTPELTEALCRQVGPDAIVIDNGSSPGKNYAGENRCIRQENLGFTGGWNRAICTLWNEFDAFWLMNSDIEISKECIERIQSLMDTGLYPVLTPSFNCWMKQCRNHSTGIVREIQCLELTAPIIRKDVFAKIGLFDTQFKLGSGVDFDFCLRAQKLGIKIYCDDNSSFLHLEHRTIKSMGTLKEYSRRANMEMSAGMENLYGRNWKELVKKKLNINKVIMKKVAVYTTIFGGYDDLHPVIKQSVQADYFCITDDAKRLKSEPQDDEKYEKWNIVQVEQPRKDLHPRMRAKWYKVFPWECAQLRDYEVVIFIDGDVDVRSPEMVAYFLRNLKSDLLVFRHPYRKCIYDERDASAAMVKYKDEDLDRQVDFYRLFHPAGAGLYACTVIIRKQTQRIQALMMSWWHENIKFTWQDQLSFPVVCRVHHIVPDVLPDQLYSNQYFKVMPHANKADQEMLTGVRPAVKENKTVLVVGDKSSARANVINMIIDALNYTRYLEIGLRTGDTFDKVQCILKHSVDPVAIGDHIPTFLMTSNEFFNQNTEKYDLIFIDGDHNYKQVKWDVEHSLDIISEGGCIVLHDTNPPSERFTKADRSLTAYKVLPFIANSNLQVSVYTLTLPTDEANGISILFKGEKNTKIPEDHPKDIYDYQFFDKNRQVIANLVTEDAFIDILATNQAGRKE